MSKSDRDQRGRPHSGKRCYESRVGGCDYCRTGDYKPFDRRAARTEKKRTLRQALRDIAQG